MKNTIQKSIDVISGLTTKIIKIEKDINQTNLLSGQYYQLIQKLQILSGLLNQQVKQQDFSKLIGWRITGIDKDLIDNNFDISGMLDYVIGEYKFSVQPITDTIYSKGCGSRTYWFQPGGQIYTEEHSNLFAGNYSILYLDTGSAEKSIWHIFIQGLMHQQICGGIYQFDYVINYKDIDLRTLGFPITLQPIFGQGDDN